VRTLIDGYRNLPGEHCGSTAMRNLIHHYHGLELSEAEVFGLGSGIEAMVLHSEAIAPSWMVFGRSITLETDVASALGLGYREEPELDDGEAWAKVRAEVLAGRPTMLSGDAYYLDYRDFQVHFPAHRFVLLGFDDEEEVAFVADRLEPAPQRCSLAALKKSRNPPDFISTYNLWGRFEDAPPTRSLEEAYFHALGRSTRRMLGLDPSQRAIAQLLARGKPLEAQSGLAGLEALGEALPRWAEDPDIERVAGYAAGCLEKFGTGGGNFRRLYAGFLERAERVVPEAVPAGTAARATEAAACWTELAAALLEMAGPESGRAAALRASQGHLRRILELERALFEGLAARLAG
jgi:hypothetical protein